MSKQKKLKTEWILKLSQVDIAPPIWREVAFDCSEPLECLHAVIQALFLWEDSHLHQFVSKGKYYGNTEFLDQEDVIEECDTTVSSLLKKKGDKLLYEYDFGDGWEIEIEVTDSWNSGERPYLALPACLAGERAAPPEDCGGVPGYYRLVDALRDPTEDSNAELLEWLGRIWNPETFDVNAANIILAQKWEAIGDTEAEDVLEAYSEVVLQQIEENRIANVRKTYDRLIGSGMEPSVVIGGMALAFMRERSITRDPERIDEKLYEEILNGLPNMPWLEQLDA